MEQFLDIIKGRNGQWKLGNAECRIKECIFQNGGKQRRKDVEKKILMMPEGQVIKACMTPGLK